MTDKELYHAFRNEIDDYAFDLELRCAVFKPIYDGLLKVGFLMVIGSYIEGLYVEPKYRRKGLARKAVYEYVRDYGLPRRLHTVNTNKPAIQFWNTVFNLRIIEVGEIDTLWEVVSYDDSRYVKND